MKLLEVSPETPVNDVITWTTRELQQSAFQYVFDAGIASSSHILSHERHALQLLGLVNKGTSNSDSVVRLKVTSHSPQLTVGQMLANRNLYAHPELCLYEHRFVQNDVPFTETRFIIHMGKFRLHSIYIC